MMPMDERTSTDRTLTAALRAVAADEERWRTSATVEAHLLATVRGRGRARRRRRATLLLAAAAALFAAIVIPSGDLRGGPSGDARRGGSASGVESLGAHEITTDFYPLAYSLVPASDGRIVRLEVSRAALDRFGAGWFGDSSNPSSTVLADVVVGDDGLARAVRFVRFEDGVTGQEQQP